tara:strand:- start:81 stop:380 length:300 start_codon:yes stop_codon:yes gene_type:complete
MSYFNTNNESGETLSESNAKALSQDEEVLRLFRVFDALTVNPETIHKHLQDTNAKYKNVPLTSTRRSFSNLYNRGLIEKTNQMVTGSYGKKIHNWRLSK